MRERIERNAFLRITKALIMALRDGLTDSSIRIKQSIIEELADILGVERCVIFKIDNEDINGVTETFCEIVAGVPQEEYCSDSCERTRLADHPDVMAAAGNGRTFVIKDPCNDERTAYFKGIVEKRNISEILYVPLFIEDGHAAGVIVVDATDGLRFTDDEILFCAEVAELVSLLLGQESAMLQHMRDVIINKIVPLGGFAKKLRDNLHTTLTYIEIIHKEAQEISSILPRKLTGIL